MIDTYLFIKKAQLKKKISIYMQAFRLVFDVTSMVYLIPLLGYIIFAISKENNFLEIYYENKDMIEAFSVDRFWTIAVSVPFAYLFFALISPGVLFTSSEYKLILMPHSVYQVWLMRAIERWVLAFVKLIIPAIIIYLMSPTSLLLIVLYVVLLLGMNILMTGLGWKFFQLRLLPKVGILVLALATSGMSIFYNSIYLAAGVILLLILANIWVYPRLFNWINWDQVIAINDFKLWNMPMVQRLTKEAYKRDKQISLLQKMSFWKRPFIYQNLAVYQRLWHVYFEKHIAVNLQFIGAIFILLLIFVFVKPGLFLFVLAFAVHAVTTYAATVFKNRLQTDIVEVLPWDITVFSRTFKSWIYVTSTIFVIPFLIFAIKNSMMFFPVQLFILITAFVLLLREKIFARVIQWTNHEHKNEWLDLGSYALILIVAFSEMYPLLLIIGVVIAIFLIFVSRKGRWG